jgi:hypothetical protein
MFGSEDEKIYYYTTFCADFSNYKTPFAVGANHVNTHGRYNVFNWADAHQNPCEYVNLMQLSALFPELASTYAPTARALIDGANYSAFAGVPPASPQASAAADARIGLRTVGGSGRARSADSIAGGGAEGSHGSWLRGAAPAPYTPGAQAKRSCCIWYEGDTCFSCVVGLIAYSSAGSLAELHKLLPLDYLFERRAVGFFRSSWTDPKASWLGFKGAITMALVTRKCGCSIGALLVLYNCAISYTRVLF